MRSQYLYHIRRLLNVDAAAGGGGGDNSPRNTRSLSPASSSSSMVENPEFKPTLGFDSSMAVTILILLSALFFMVFFSMYLRRFADDNNNSFNVSRRRRRPSSSSSTAAAVNAIITSRFDPSSSFSSSNGLDPSTIRSLPLYSYAGNGNTTDDDDDNLCSVCLSEFQEKEMTKVIPYCGHAFHPQCIDMWFFSHSSCPLCRSTQLFRDGSTSAAAAAAVKMMMMKEKDCLVEDVRSSQKRFCSEHNTHTIVIDESESPGKSTVESGDTSSVAGAVAEEAASGGLGLRKSSSWSGLDEKVLLKRSLSF